VLSDIFFILLCLSVFFWFINYYFIFRMGRTKAEIRKKGGFTKDDMQMALALVKHGVSMRKAAKDCKLAYPTLRRYVIKTKDNPQIRLVPNYEVNAVFSPDQETILVKYIEECALMFYGLTAKETRQLAYQMAVANSIKCPDTWARNEMAGKDWLRSFKKRHNNISLKKPETCSIARATAFNKVNVERFYNNLKEALQRHPTFGDGTRIYNLDETATTTVQRPSKVLAPKGSSICKVTSGERGVLVTTCCIVSATGHALPPAMVFPRKNFKSHMLNGAPAATLGLATPTGWMNADIFVEVIKHFVKHTAATKENPALLIMDNHESHLSLEALNLAKSSGVTVLTLPPHTTAKLQPLDVGLNGPFKSYYNSAIDSWLLRNPGQAVTIYNIGEFVGQAYLKAMTPVNITNAFKKCGIYPFDDSIFTDADFLPSSVTDRPDPDKENTEMNIETGTSESTQPIPSILHDAEPSQVIHDHPVVNAGSQPIQSSEANASRPAPDAIFSSNQDPDLPYFNTSSQQPEPLNMSMSTENSPQQAGPSKAFVTPQMIRPPLKAPPRKNTKRRRTAGKSMIATDTPEKEEIAKRKNKAAKRVKNANLFKSKKKEKSLQNAPADDTSEDDVFEASGESSGGEQFGSETDEDEIIIDRNFAPLRRNPKVGDYVIVMIESERKKEYHYVAKILEEDDASDYDYFVSYLKVKSKVYFKFSEPIEPDTAGITKGDVKYILPKPKIDGTKRRQATYQFPVNLSLLNFPF
jgi:hypothetical protein